MSAEARINQLAIARLSNADVCINGVMVRGIFEDPALQENIGGLGIDTTTPNVKILSGDWIAPAKTVLVNGVSWRVAGKKPDGGGMICLQLER